MTVTKGDPKKKKKEGIGVLGPYREPEKGR